MSESRKVGSRGQVTIPKHLREEHNIHPGDTVTFSEEDDILKIEKKVDDKALAHAYQALAKRAQRENTVWNKTSTEANQYLDR